MSGYLGFLKLPMRQSKSQQLLARFAQHISSCSRSAAQLFPPPLGPPGDVLPWRPWILSAKRIEIEQKT